MHLFSKENIWSNPHSCNNNSVVRIISKEEEREDPRRDSSIYLRVQNTVVFPHFYKISSNTVYSTVFPHAIQQLQVILHTELILLQEFSKKYYNYKAHPVQITTRHLPATVPCASKQFYTAESSYKAPYSIPGPYSTSRLPVILPGRNSILHGSQHPRSPYSNSQASSTVLHYRILPGEIGFIPRVKYCISNTILRSVCSNLLVTRNFNSIQSSSYSMRRYSTLSSIQVVLVAILHKIH